MLPVEPPQGAQRDKGFVLVIVLWSVVLLALLAAGFSISVRSYIRSVTTDKEIVQAEALADGGVNLALLDLSTARQSSLNDPRFSPGNAAVGCSIDGGAQVYVRVDDESGKLNLNLASEDLLVSVFAGAGATPEQARAYAAVLLDFRDGDDDRRPDGAERDDYVAAGALAMPKDGPFDSVDELDQVLNLPPELVASLKPLATVHSGISGIDTAAALPGLKAILDAGALQSATGGLNPASERTAVAALSNDRAYTVHALARLPTGVQYASKAIVEFPERSLQRHQLRQWRQESAADALGGLVPENAELPPC